MVEVKTNMQSIAAKTRKLVAVMPGLLDREMKQLAQEAKSDYEQTVATWEKAPTFAIKKVVGGYSVQTSSKLYKMVDETGAKKHKIVAKRKKALYFMAASPGNYVPKTQPKVINSNYAYYNGVLRRVVRKSVDHPGFKPRKFSETIQKKYGVLVANKRIRQAVTIGQEAAGL